MLLKNNNNEIKSLFDSSIEPSSLLEYGYRVLNTSETVDKAKLTLNAYQLYKTGQLPIGLDSPHINQYIAPLKPQRPAALTTRAPCWSCTCATSSRRRPRRRTARHSPPG